jgi:adenylate cyclase
MGTEIERKFLVKDDSWRASADAGTRILQGYLVSDPKITVRVRIRGEAAFLTIKGATAGIRRSEFEYPIPVDDAESMLREMAVSPVIEKIRYRLPCGAHVWDLDVFGGDNAGLVLAEVELDAEEAAFEMPDWAGQEVSGDPRYYNVNLARSPFRHWSSDG